jgi:hypothetical protein
MKKIQTIKKRRLTILTVTARRQNLLEKKILSLYLTEEKDNLNDITFGY